MNDLTACPPETFEHLFGNTIFVVDQLTILEKTRFQQEIRALVSQEYRVHVKIAYKATRLLLLFDVEAHQATLKSIIIGVDHTPFHLTFWGPEERNGGDCRGALPVTEDYTMLFHVLFLAMAGMLNDAFRNEDDDSY
uniref:Uncharacterized protein n=1 Tax=Phlebotomus papatasi TaxID=29031 RepID=A0A1B0DCK6_PHLPP